MDKNYTKAANHIRLAYKHLRDAYKILNGTLDIMVSGVDYNSFFYHPYPKTCRLARIKDNFDIEDFLKTAEEECREELDEDELCSEEEE